MKKSCVHCYFLIQSFRSPENGEERVLHLSEKDRQSIQSGNDPFLKHLTTVPLVLSCFNKDWHDDPIQVVAKKYCKLFDPFTRKGAKNLGNRKEEVLEINRRKNSRWKGFWIVSSSIMFYILYQFQPYITKIIWEDIIEERFLTQLDTLKRVVSDSNEK